MDISAEFKKKFNTAETPLSVYCPYRIAPVGAHSDYQHGLISGFAINEGVQLDFLPTEDGSVKLYSLNFEGAAEFSAFELAQRSYNWGDFAKAAFVSVKRKHRVEKGMIGIIYGSLPVGGLSSSAAVLISYICAICKANDIKINRAELIDLALYAEHDYIEMNVGKMDQSCEVYSKKDHSIRQQAGRLLGSDLLDYIASNKTEKSDALKKLNDEIIEQLIDTIVEKVIKQKIISNEE